MLWMCKQRKRYAFFVHVVDFRIRLGPFPMLVPYFLPEIALVTVSPVMAVMVTSLVTKSSLVRSPVKELSPVRHFHR